VNTLDKLKKMTEDLLNAKEKMISLDLETTGLCNTVAPGIKTDKIVGYCLSGDGHTGYYVPVRHNIGLNIPPEVVKPYIQKIVNNTIMLGFNLKFDREFLETTEGILCPPYPAYRDTQALMFLLNPDEHLRISLKESSRKMLDMEMIELYELFGYSKKPSRKEMNIINFADLDPNDCIHYAGSDAICTYLLYQKIRHVEELSSSNIESQPFIAKYEQLVIDAVRDMERGRMRIDVPYLIASIDDKNQLLDSLRDRILLITGNINIDSSQQLGKVIFEDLGVEHAGMTETGKYKTDASSLESLKGKHPIIALLLDYRKLKKQIKDYMLKLLNATHVDGMTKFCFSPIGAPTGRFAAPGGDVESGYSGVNVQSIPSLYADKKAYAFKTSISLEDFNKLPVLRNDDIKLPVYFPVRGGHLVSFLKTVWCFRNHLDDKKAKEDKEGFKADKEAWEKSFCEGCPNIDICKEKSSGQVSIGLTPNVRRAFCARPGYKLAAIDFKGIELRIAALLSEEPVWIETFLNPNGDLHAATAKKVFHTSSPTKAQRQIGKVCNFQILYGASGYGLSSSIPDSTPEECEKYIEAFYSGLPGLAGWIRAQHSFARKNHYVKTMFGRLRYLSMYKFKDKKSQGFGDRSSVNTPVQGTSADIIKICMSLTHRYIQKNNLQDIVRMCLCVHDEIVFEIKTTELDNIIPRIMEIMCLKLPKWPFALGVDVEVGDNWGEIVDWVPGMYSDEVTPDNIQITSAGSMLNLEILTLEESVMKDIKNFISVCKSPNGMGITLGVEGNSFYLSKIKINKDKLISLLEERLTPEYYNITVSEA